MAPASAAASAMMPVVRALEAAARLAERRQEEAVPKAEARDKAKEEVVKDKKAEDKKNVKSPVIDWFGPVSLTENLTGTMMKTAPAFEPLPVLVGVVLLVGLMLNT